MTLALRPPSAPAQALRQARPLLAPDIALAATDPLCPHNAALADEIASLPRATTARQREFTAGRAAVHDAMRLLGLPPQPVRQGPDRAPIWPQGLTGSISHTDTACLAAIGRTETTRAIGLDLESSAPLDADLVPVICTPAEQNALRALPRGQQLEHAKLIFSAKECAYKAQYPISRTLFDFQTLTVAIHPETFEFTARFTQDVAPFRENTRLNGRYARNDALIVTAIILRY